MFSASQKSDFIDDYRPGLKPLRALAALARFLRNKEATHEVFRLIAALDGPVGERQFRRFATTATGRTVLGEKRDLWRKLADRETLASMPAGSLGRAYLDFITREGLSVEGFQKEMDAAGEAFDHAGEHRQRYIYRVRHSHDLYHVLTGYGRDFIGEIALLAFTRQQTRSHALRLLIATGMIKAMRDYPGLPVRACVAEGRTLGRATGDMIAADWEALLPLPLAEARHRLGIGIPRRYLAIQHSAETIDRRYREQLAGI